MKAVTKPHFYEWTHYKRKKKKKIFNKMIEDAIK